MTDLRPIRARRGADDGAALVEFVLLGVVLIVPLVYLVLAVFEVQRAAYATSTAAREATRVFVLSPTTADAHHRADTAWRLALDDQGVSERQSRLTIACEASPCLTPGATVQVTVRTTVPLPFVPWLGDGPVASIPVTASHQQSVDLHAELRP